MSDRPQAVSEPTWFKSSHSGGNTTECIETALASSHVLVRDSKTPQGSHLSVSAEAWTKFVKGLTDT
ncbi:DUF397 domain-containing protein [Streptomyces sp. NPDC050211]|uniref:DUF397 domain-containing protein n=1 Tax=Streptomyces sp. NPDC050211 TaxID=3154932 RepID=UPI00342BB85A